MTIVVDVANVMGARPDGWWRDRAGAALRLGQQVEQLAAHGVTADQLPDGLLAHADPESAGANRVIAADWVLVLEGRARDAAPAMAGSSPAVRVVVAAGSGDDAIVSAAAAASAHGSCLVVTADRELRRRCAAAGAVPAGPGWLLGLLKS